jgi:hypothetical protein
MRRTGRRSSTGGKRVKSTEQTKAQKGKKRDRSAGVKGGSKGGDSERKVYGSGDRDEDRDRDRDRDRKVYGSGDMDRDRDRDRDREESGSIDLERYQSSNGVGDRDGWGEDLDILYGDDVHLSFSTRKHQYRNFLIETWRPSACFADTLTGGERGKDKGKGTGKDKGKVTGTGTGTGTGIKTGAGRDKDKDKGSDHEEKRNTLGHQIGTGGVVGGIGGSRIEQGIPEVIAAQAIAAAEEGAV